MQCDNDPPLLVQDPGGQRSIVDQGNFAAGNRILWGAAFSLAIFKIIKVRVSNILIQYYNVITFLISHLNVQIGIATKYFGPIILSISSMLQDVFLFLITFCVIMVAFGCGVSFIFNMASGLSGTIVQTDTSGLLEPVECMFHKIQIRAEFKLYSHLCSNTSTLN